MLTVLFVSVHDASRGPMAVALFNRIVDSRIARAISAGFFPGRAMHAVVVQAMRDVGFDLGPLKPRRLTGEVLEQASLIIDFATGATLGAPNELVWDVPRIRPPTAEGVHKVREALERQIRQLIEQRGWRSCGGECQVRS